MAQINQPIFKLNNFHHLGMIVRDLDETVTAMWSNFGLGPWDLRIRDPDSPRENERVSGQVYLGKPTKYAINIGFATIGDSQVELIQPVRGVGLQSDYLKKHGEGIQHLAYLEIDTFEQLADLQEKMEKAGYVCLASGRSPIGGSCAFDTTKQLYSFLEIAKRPPSPSAQKSETPVYPAAVATVKPLINIKRLEQIGIVVRDIDKTVANMWNTFGIGPWNISTRTADSLQDMKLNGKPAHFGFKIARTQHKLGCFEIELIEPLEGDSTYKDFLKTHGEGIHHLGWYRVKSLEEFNDTIKKLEKAGFPCTMSARVGHVAFAYFDTNKVLKTALEMVLMDKSAAPPPPARVYP